MSRWPLVPFSEALVDVSGGNKKVAQSEYLSTGRLPIVDQGRIPIAGYTDDEACTVHGELPVIVFGDHTRTFKYLDFPFAMGADGTKVLRARSDWSTKFLYHFLRQTQLPAAGYSRHFKFLREISIPKPPIEEQWRIADILDRADHLRAKRQRTITLVDDLTRSVFWTMFGSPLGSTRFDRRPLREIADYIRGVAFKPSQVTIASDPLGVPVMRTKNVQADLDLSDQMYIPRSVVRRDDQFLVQGDTLVSSANSWNLVGRCCLVPALERLSTFGAFVSVLRPKNAELMAVFLHHWFASDEVQRTVRGFGQQTTNISNLNADRTLRLTVPVPPLEIQQEFIAILDARTAEKMRLAGTSAVTDSLAVSLAQRSFRGEL